MGFMAPRHRQHRGIGESQNSLPCLLIPHIGLCIRVIMIGNTLFSDNCLDCIVEYIGTRTDSRPSSDIKKFVLYNTLVCVGSRR